MIISEKIMSLRKQYGWSQEELADLVGVSRQSVSKWESATSMPDIQKIIKMSEVFGVSVDYLLKDEIDLPESSNAETTEDIASDVEKPIKTVSLEEANEYLEESYKQANRIAGAVGLFIISPVAYILAENFANENNRKLLERISLAAMFIIIAIGVALCILSSFALSKYEYLSKDELKLGYGVEAAVKHRYAPFKEVIGQKIAVGVFLCIVGVLPGIIFDDSDKRFSQFENAAWALTLIMVAAGVYTFVKVGIIGGSYKKLLQEGDYTPYNKRIEQKMAPIAGAYWIIITAIYLTLGFLFNYWNKAWVIWPIAGLLYGLFYKICEVFLSKKDYDK